MKEGEMDIHVQGCW